MTLSLEDLQVCPCAVLCHRIVCVAQLDHDHGMMQVPQQMLSLCLKDWKCSLNSTQVKYIKMAIMMSAIA